jgi:3-hydroxyacyl-[acyl-carrier-protein] dehydratase
MPRSLRAADSPSPFTLVRDSERETLRHVLRHCPPEVFAAAAAFRRTGDPAAAATALLGIVERFASEPSRARLRDDRTQLRLREDLGLDSLAQLEVSSLAEDALGLSLTDEDLRSVRTVGDLLALAQRTMLPGRRKAGPSR